MDSLLEKIKTRCVWEKDCFVWQGSKSTAGYGQVRWKGCVLYVHRAMFQETKGALDGKHVLHTCDNPLCCNPDHLVSGTNLDNINDRHKKRRDARGEQVGNSKLCQIQVDMIRCLCAANFSPQVIAQQFGVHEATVTRINTQKSWIYQT